MKKIQIEHLGYTIYIKENKDSRFQMYIETSNQDNDSCTLYTKKNIKPIDFTTLAHEVVHVLQHISQVRYISFEETEHFGYLMQYILNRLLGLKYK